VDLVVIFCTNIGNIVRPAKKKSAGNSARFLIKNKGAEMENGAQNEFITRKKGCPQ